MLRQDRALFGGSGADDRHAQCGLVIRHPPRTPAVLALEDVAEFVALAEADEAVDRERRVVRNLAFKVKLAKTSDR